MRKKHFKTYLKKHKKKDEENTIHKTIKTHRTMFKQQTNKTSDISEKQKKLTKQRTT